jgi:chromosome segregation ATPase
MRRTSEPPRLHKSFGNKAETTMADNSGAKTRLETAVQRLEMALSRVIGPGGAQAGDVDRLRQDINGLDSELTALRAERDNLIQELADARAEGAALQGSMDAVSNRLDHAIETAHALLDE